jgi:hypothetical protein
MREDSHYTLGNKLILIIPEGSSCDYIRNRKFIQWQSTVLPISTIKSTVLPISTIKSTVLPISTITSHLTGHQNTTYYDENPGTLDRQEHKCGVVKSINGNTRTIQNVY